MNGPNVELPHTLRSTSERQRAQAQPLPWVVSLVCALMTLASPAGTTRSDTLTAGIHEGGPEASRPAQSRVVRDDDGDGLDDALEDRLAERHAPVLFHGEDETTFPTSVDSWLERTHLSFADPAASGAPRRVVSGPLRQHHLPGRVASVSNAHVSSSGTRSRGKRASFVLENTPADSPAQVIQPADWVTYVHSYPNAGGGVTLQYWRAYTRNDSSVLGIDVGHGGDWEAVAVHLNVGFTPSRTTFLDHTGIVDWRSAVRWEGTHLLVWSEEGGHASAPDDRRSRSKRWLRHETWTGGNVTRWDATPIGPSGGLLNVGEKTRPRNGQVFIQYSGLWGAPGRLFLTSGYWGPAFNETDAQCENGTSAYKPFWRRAEAPGCGRVFIKAWCDGADARRLDLDAECYAASEAQ